ncbi:Cytochrome P450 [Methylomagnum ishizawai]|uniref:Cytochrome P450 n=1 Tax=Methylomagnum ishizawai TaxID=1760988 RepID=A0A1Y6D4I6_9GAMM|nr:cytochrome P450 [Methylomagnum ishizawai]SMF97330.1 Cytochrome P450 [Methylomagnum ishizawai]
MTPAPLLPPGPQTRFWQPLAYVRSPYRFFRAIHARYGDPFTVRTVALTAMTAHPEGIRQIFTAPADTYHVKLPPSQRRVLGRHGLSGLDGEAHRRTRKLISPSFHGESLRGLGGMIHATAVESLAAWQPGSVWEARDAMRDIGLDVILRTLFGVEDRARLAPFRAAVLEFAGAFGNPAFLISALLGIEHDAWPPNRRLDTARHQLAALLRENIAERRATGTARADILSRLMEARYDDGTGFDDAALVDNLITNLVAGHETSALSLTWAFAWLGRHPEVAERLQREIDSLGRDDDIAAIQALPYLDAVVKECLRLYPAVPEVVRMLAKPLELRGYEIPAGMNVAACSAVLHMDPAFYPEPERFRPERFLERPPSGFEFIPFGGGDRVCLGNHFGVFEVKIVLAVLLTRGRFELLDRGPVRVARRGFLMGPDRVRVRFEPRR